MLQGKNEKTTLRANYLIHIIALRAVIDKLQNVKLVLELNKYLMPEILMLKPMCLSVVWRWFGDDH